MANKTRNIPLSIDDDLLAEIDRIAESTKESRSAVMRKAMREGLPLVKSGGGADILTLDSETSRDVDTASKEAKVKREKFIIEAIRTGLQATYLALMRDHWIREQNKDPNNKEAESYIAVMEHSLLLDNPTGREVRAVIRQRGAIFMRLFDILLNVPEAFERVELVERLVQLRKESGDLPTVWGCGLSNTEVRWQINWREKYGKGTPPPEEMAAHDAKKEGEQLARRELSDKVVAYVEKEFPIK